MSVTSATVADLYSVSSTSGSLLPKACSCFIGIVAAVVLAGHLLQIENLESVLPRCPQMLPNTAFCLVLFAVALWLRSVTSRDLPGWRPIVIGGAIATIITISLLSLLEQFLGYDQAINELAVLMARNATAKWEPFSTITAVGLLFGSGALFFIDRCNTAARTLAFIAGLSSLSGLAIYVYLQQIPLNVPANSPAFPTAICLVVACVGILAIRPTPTMLYLLSSCYSSAARTRVLVVGSLAVPLVVGRLAMAGLSHQLYDERFAFGAFAVVLILALMGLLWWAARIGLIAEDQQLSAENDRLQFLSELQKKNDELQTALDLSRQTAMVKEQFLNTMTHELRTPLNGILAANSLLRESPLCEEQRELVDIILESGEALLQVIENVLELSHLRSGHWALHTAPVNIRDVVARVAASVMPLAELKHLRWKESVQEAVPPVITGDAMRLQQVMTRLVLNSIKFTVAGEVSLSVLAEGDKKAGRRLRVQVTDTGIGVTQEAASKLFLPFFQADASSTRTQGGCGLGLALSKEVVHRMGGEIGVINLEGGSLFWFTAPFELPECMQQ